LKLCLNCGGKFDDEKTHCPADGLKLVSLEGGSLVGTVIDDRYKIESIIGRGALGTVYKANQELVGRPVAVKVLHSYLISDPETVKRFQQEARGVSRLKHPHIITVFDYGLLPNGLPYIAMDYLEGDTLAKILHERKLLSIKELMPIIKQVCDALEEAHNCGVIHRDVTPDNIVLIEQGGQKNFVKVVDFGIAKLLRVDDETLSSLTKAGSVGGSPVYMSPERITNKEINHRSDIYSLGVVIFESLVGRPPFASTDAARLMLAQVNEIAPRLKDIRPDFLFPQELEDVIAKALAKAPDERQATMGQLRDELMTATNKMLVGFGKIDLTAELQAAAFPKEPEAVSGEEMSDLFRNHVESQGKKFAEHMQMREEIAAEQERHRERLRDHTLKVKTDVSIFSRLIAYVQILIPYCMCLILLTVLVWFLRTEPMFSSFFKEGKKVNQSEVDRLISAGKLHQAKDLLEYAQKSGTLSNADFETLNRVYLRLAKHYIKYKDYRQARSVLEKVSPKSTVHKQAEALLKRLK
jgi:tRNA A-37 threonylcarbamoyl transferase component Bud32